MAKELSWYEQYQKDHPIVECDANCGALREPKTKKELVAAVNHWRSHSSLSGCSHGC